MKDAASKYENIKNLFSQVLKVSTKIASQGDKYLFKNPNKILYDNFKVSNDLTNNCAVMDLSFLKTLPKTLFFLILITKKYLNLSLAKTSGLTTTRI